MVINRKPMVAQRPPRSSLVAPGRAVAAGRPATAANSSSSEPGTKGGTLYYLTLRALPSTLDPQRTYIGRDISNFEPAGLPQAWWPTRSPTDAEEARPPRSPTWPPTPGSPATDAKDWKFTLKDGVKWQDGKPITCEDFKYGVSRTFATDVITGGPNYILGLPRRPDGQGRPAALQRPVQG